MKPLLEWRITRRIAVLVEPRDLWVGVFWDRRPGLVFYVGVPLLVLRVDLGSRGNRTDIHGAVS